MKPARSAAHRRAPVPLGSRPQGRPTAMARGYDDELAARSSAVPWNGPTPTRANSRLGWRKFSSTDASATGAITAGMPDGGEW